MSIFEIKGVFITKDVRLGALGKSPMPCDTHVADAEKVTTKKKPK